MTEPVRGERAGLSTSDAISVGNLPIPPTVRSILLQEGISSLYPPQAEALGPVFRGESVVLACPTASGKSLVAYLALERTVRAGRTGLYLVPLRALAHEKYEELSAFAPLGLKIGLAIGDYDLPTAALEKLDILVATSEKADGLLRKGAPWLDRLGVVVADEVHLLRDPDRGPTLEVSLTRLRRAHPKLQVVALSATVGNSVELARWLNATHIASDFRPVPLKSGTYVDGRISFTDLSVRPVPGPGEPVPRLVRDVLAEGGQALVFVSTRRASEQVASQLVPVVEAMLSPAQRAAARAAADDLGGGAEEDTEGARRLAALLPHGVAFHNASLTNPERRVVERAFRAGTLLALTATPTLAAGINLPARRVVVRDLFRYDDRLGVQTPIPTLEVQQMCGRAGRPRFDPSGEAVLIARNVPEQEDLFDRYLTAPPEDVESRLAAEPALRMHLLALVASGAVSDERQLEAFFGATFFGHTRSVVELADTVRAVRDFLETNDLLIQGRSLKATPFGELTSTLYLDPLSAIVLRSALERAPLNVRPFPLLAAVAATPDLPPLFTRRSDERALLDRYTEEEAELLVKPEEEPLELDLDVFLATLKTASVLEGWTEERPLVELTEQFGVGAGDVHAKVEDADWLLFGASRLAFRFQRRVVQRLDALSLRVRYGVREELLDLVRLRGVGRVRGRRLFDAGYPDRDALARASAGEIARILGSPKLAESVLKQLRPAHRAARPTTEANATPPPEAPPATPRSRPPGSPTRARRTLEEF